MSGRNPTSHGAITQTKIRIRGVGFRATCVARPREILAALYTIYGSNLRHTSPLPLQRGRRSWNILIKFQPPIPRRMRGRAADQGRSRFFPTRHRLLGRCTSPPPHPNPLPQGRGGSSQRPICQSVTRRLPWATGAVVGLNGKAVASARSFSLVMRPTRHLLPIGEGSCAPVGITGCRQRRLRLRWHPADVRLAACCIVPMSSRPSRPSRREPGPRVARVSCRCV